MSFFESPDFLKGIENRDLRSQTVRRKTEDAHCSKISSAIALSMALVMPSVIGCKSSFNSDSKESFLKSTACSPLVSCPDLQISSSNMNPYKIAGERDIRFGDDQGNIAKRVCESANRNFCKSGQDPVTDSCELPVCENAAAKVCDPIPGRESQSEPLRRPEFANYPTSSVQIWASTSNDIKIKNGSHPKHRRIFDDVPSCQPGENPISSNPDENSSLHCDPFPTCSKDNQVEICDNLPRCQPGEAPVSCSEGNRRFAHEEPCIQYWDAVTITFYDHTINLHEIVTNELACAPNKFLPPQVKMNCLFIPRCQDGENPVSKLWDIPIDCETYRSDISSVEGPSCDRIRSCSESK